MRKYSLGNEDGGTEITQQINAEYDHLFTNLSKETQSDNQSNTYAKDDESNIVSFVGNEWIYNIVLSRRLLIFREIAQYKTSGRNDQIFLYSFRRDRILTKSYHRSILMIDKFGNTIMKAGG